MMRQVGAQDAQFIYMESENNLAHVTMVVIYDPSTAPGGHVRFKDIIAHVASRQHLSPVFKQRMVHVPLELDYPYWVADEHYDIEYHIQHGALPAPGDWRQFCIHLARYHSRPLDMHRPLWEMYVIGGLDNVEGLPRGCYAVATKVHHVAVDGASMFNFFGVLSDINAKGKPVFDTTKPEAALPQLPSMRDMVVRGVFNNLNAPVRIAETVLRSAPSIYQGLQAVIGREPDDESHAVPDTRFNGSVSPHKMLDGRAFPLDDFKQIKQLVPGSTINDVVLAVCAGGLRRYLQHHRELPADSLVGWVPINRRTPGSSDSEVTGNNISAMTVPIHTEIEDAAERLAAIYIATQASKEARSGVAARLMTDITRHVPAATQVMAARMVLRSGLAGKMCNLFISNVPGSAEPFYMNGAKAINMMGMAPLADGMGLFIATPSYNGKLMFTVTSTREILPDIDFFMACLEQSVDELKQLSPALKKPASSKGRATVRKPSTRPQKAASSGRTKAKAKAKAKAKVKAKTGKGAATAKAKSSAKKVRTRAKSRPKGSSTSPR